MTIGNFHIAPVRGFWVLWNDKMTKEFMKVSPKDSLHSVKKEAYKEIQEYCKSIKVPAPPFTA